MDRSRDFLRPVARWFLAFIDRLLHRAEIVDIAGDSYRLKEAKERAAQKCSCRKRKA